MKNTVSEIKKNLQRTSSGGDEARIQINELEHKEEISIRPELKEETRIQKNEDTKKHAPNERTEQNSRKRTKQDGDKQSARCRVQSTDYRDA